MTIKRRKMENEFMDFTNVGKKREKGGRKLFHWLHREQLDLPSGDYRRVG